MLSERSHGTRRWYHRPWRVAGGVTLLLLSLLVHVAFRDEGPPDDADVIPMLSSGASPGNPLERFCNELGSELQQDVRSQLCDVNGIPTDKNAAVALFERRQREWLLVQQLVQTEADLWRWPETIDVSTITDV